VQRKKSNFGEIRRKSLAKYRQNAAKCAFCLMGKTLMIDLLDFLFYALAGRKKTERKSLGF